MAARQLARDRECRADRRSRQGRGPYARRYFGAGLRRPGRALLAAGRARRAVRLDARDRTARIRARRAGERLFSDRRSSHRDAVRLAGRRTAIQTLRVDGGMANSDWTMQRLADLIGCTVDRPQISETTALGCCLSRRPPRRFLSRAGSLWRSLAIAAALRAANGRRDSRAKTQRLEHSRAPLARLTIAARHRRAATTLALQCKISRQSAGTLPEPGFR